MATGDHLRSVTDEIGYVCRQGHYVFYADPEGSDACGSKSIALITVTWDVDAFVDVKEIDDLKADCDSHLTNVIKAYRES